MTLPPIPDEAVTAVLLAAGVPDAEPGEREWAAGDLAAAWPHLYAAALRHAADEFDSRAWVDSHDLRRVADEASATDSAT